MPAGIGRLAIAVAALSIPACSQFRPPAEGSERAKSIEKREGGGDPCVGQALIEDGEDGDDQIATRGGRGGFLYTFADDKGTSIEPKGDEVKPTGGGANGSSFALRIHGKLGEQEDAYAGIGFSFTEPKALYDASRWRGISFVARRGPNSAQAVRFKIPDVSTDPDGKVCTDCFNDFGVTFQVGEEWTRFEVAFADLTQEPDWGTPRPAAIEAGKVYGVQWQIIGRASEYDVWIDDVSFLGCPAPGQEK
jgi:hypothetical protein